MGNPQFNSSKTVFVVESQVIYRLGLEQFLRREPGLEFLAESGRTQGTAERILDAEPVLTILEICLADGSGLDLIKELRSMGFSGSILVLSSQDESLYAERALRAGANGYVMKSESPEALRNAIHSVLAGEVYISDAMNARLLRRMTGAGGRTDSDQGALDRLTDREIQVLELIGSGLMTREIAGRLSISSKTVDTHRINIRQKLGIPDVNELIRFAVHWLGGGSGNGMVSGHGHG